MRYHGKLRVTKETKHDLLNQAVAYRKAEQFERAQWLLKQILTRFPDDILALNETGIILIKLGYFHEAKEYFQRILTIKPSDSYALNQLGVIYNKQGDHDRALQAFETVLAVDSTNIHALSELASYYSRIGDNDHALSYIKQLSLSSREKVSELKETQREIRQTTTELKQTQREIEQKDAQLAAAGRITTANAMATSLAHQINNPLHNIQAIVYRLEQRIPVKQKSIRDELFRIKLQADRINTLITHLNKLIKDEPSESSYFPISEVIEGAFNLFEEQLRNRRITVDLTDIRHVGRPLTVHGSAIKLEQVFINLIANSRDALRHTRRAKITVSLERSDNAQVVIDFADNGRGIPKRNLDKVFDSLFTTKPSGTGLGLWLCASVIYQMSGTVRVQSVQRKGTTFSIYLPNYGGVE